METEQYTIEWPMGPSKNQVGNKKFLQSNKNENTTQILWGTMKAILIGKHIAIGVYIKMKEILKYILMMHLKTDKRKPDSVSLDGKEY